MVIKRACVRKCSSTIQALGGYFKTIIPHVTFSISAWGRFSPATFVEIEGLHLKAAKIIERLPKNIMDCDILQRVHRQNLGWFYKRRLAIEMSKAKHMLNRLCQYVYKCGLVRGKGLRKLIEISRKKRQSLGGGGCCWLELFTVKKRLLENIRTLIHLKGFSKHLPTKKHHSRFHSLKEPAWTTIRILITLYRVLYP